LRAVKDINERARIISGEAQKPKETGEVIYNPVFDAFGAKALEALEAVIFSGEGPAPDVTEANRSIEVAGELLALEPKLFPSLERQASIGVVKRGEISVVAANNQRVYEALLQHTESGTLALRPGEYLASPPSLLDLFLIRIRVARSCTRRYKRIMSLLKSFRQRSRVLLGVQGPAVVFVCRG
jgi:hypothetical protein